MSSSGRHPWDANDPYPDDDRPEDECEHLDYEANVLTGEAICACGHRWLQTAAEIAEQRENQAAYDEMCAEWEREDRKPINRLRRFVGRVRNACRRPIQTDEIPF